MEIAEGENAWKEQKRVHCILRRKGRQRLFACMQKMLSSLEAWKKKRKDAKLPKIWTPGNLTQIQATRGSKGSVF